MLNQFKKDFTDSVKKEVATLKTTLQETETKLGRTTERLSRKRKVDQMDFNKKGHEDQYRHGEDVQDQIEDAIFHIEDGNPNKAIESLKEGKRLIKDRQKIVRIADREGWLTVQHFKADEITSDVEEEKKLKKAIKSASSAREKFARKPKTPLYSNKESSHASTSSSTNPNKDDTIKSTKQKMDEIVCFNCKVVGHYIHHCPFERGSGPSNLRIPVAESKSKDNSNSSG